PRTSARSSITTRSDLPAGDDSARKSRSVRRILLGDRGRNTQLRSMTMTYELFLTAFDSAETADEAATWLREFVRKGDLQVLDVVVLAKREDDSAVIRQIGDLDSRHGGRAGAIVGGLIGAAGGPVGIAALGAAGAAIGAASELLASRDLYHDDLKEMQQALAPGTSAFL